ncbi:MAG: IS5 family transposase [Chloroflexota bacterium]|nr:IS5 family transposase [Chloroflexota bacterium]
MERHALSDTHWERLQPLLPPPPRRGRPRRDDRTVVDGILWRLATGVSWRDLPARFGPWRTVDSRWRRWQRAGVWDRALAGLHAAGDAQGDLDGETHFGEMHVRDGPTVRAHQHAARAKKGAAIKPWAAPAAASRPTSTSGPRGTASRCPTS